MPDGGTAAWADDLGNRLAVAAAPLLGRLADRQGWLKACLGRYRHRRGGDGGAVVRGSRPALCADGAGAVGSIDFRNGDRLRLHNAMLTSVATEPEYGRVRPAWGLAMSARSSPSALCCFCSFYRRNRHLVSLRITRRISESLCVSPHACRFGAAAVPVCPPAGGEIDNPLPCKPAGPPSGSRHGALPSGADAVR